MKQAVVDWMLGRMAGNVLQVLLRIGAGRLQSCKHRLGAADRLRR